MSCASAANCRRRGAHLDPPSGRSAGSLVPNTGSAATSSGRAATLPTRSPRLASILPASTRSTTGHGGAATRRGLAANGLPDLQATRQYLVVARDDARPARRSARRGHAALYFHRLALFHEEIRLEDFAVLAQTLGVRSRPACASGRDHGVTPPLLFPRRAGAGDRCPGFSFDNEREPHPVSIPEFEIDAQAVTWAQYGEFVETAATTNRPLERSRPGLVERESRRTPRHVDQMRHGVLRRRFGS